MKGILTITVFLLWSVLILSKGIKKKIKEQDSKADSKPYVPGGIIRTEIINFFFFLFFYKEYSTFLEESSELVAKKPNNLQAKL